MLELTANLQPTIPCYKFIENVNPAANSNLNLIKTERFYDFGQAQTLTKAELEVESTKSEAIRFQKV